MSTEDNPFLFGKIAESDRFCNRKKEINELAAYLKSGKNIWLHSPRRFGKTSLIKKVLKKLESSNTAVAYMDVFDTLNEQDFTLIFAKNVTQALSDGLEKALELAKKTLSFLVPKITLSDEGKPELQFGISNTLVQEKLFDSIMEIINTTVHKKKTQLVVAMDEFQQVSRYENSELFLAKLRKHIQFQQKISYIFLGSQRHLMQDIFTSKKKPFYQSSLIYELKVISSEDWKLFLKDRTKKTNHPFSEKLCDKLTQITGGHPYNTEKLASFVYDYFSELPRYDSMDSFLEFVLNNICEQEDSIYKNYLNLLTIGQKIVLAAIADYNGKIPSNEMVRFYNISSRQYLDKTIKFLLQKELIEESDKGLCIYDLFFKRWLSRKARNWHR